LRSSHAGNARYDAVTNCDLIETMHDGLDRFRDLFVVHVVALNCYIHADGLNVDFLDRNVYGFNPSAFVNCGGDLKQQGPDYGLVNVKEQLSNIHVWLTFLGELAGLS
jgi:hypothetical protein